MQLLFYAWLYQQSQPHRAYQVVPAMFQTRALFEANSDPHLFVKQESDNAYIPILDISFYQEAFEAGLRAVFSELFDSHIPFSQTEDISACKHCPYKGICQR